MISRIQALNYRCLRYVDVELRPFHILVGPNASGKSTFLDVAAFMSDLLTDGLDKAILKRARTFRELIWNRVEGDVQLAIELALPDDLQSRVSISGRAFTHCRYEVSIGADGPSGEVGLKNESFFMLEGSTQPHPRRSAPRTSFPDEPSPPETIVVKKYGRVPDGWRKVVSLGRGGRANFSSETTGWGLSLRPVPQRTALSSVPEEERFPVASWAKRTLSEGIEALALSSKAMREPCRPDSPSLFLPDGSNLPLVVRALRKDPERLSRWLAHVRTVFPTVANVGFRRQAVDRFLYLSIEFSSGVRVNSWLLSDGTLRFLALTLLAYMPGDGRVLLIEEPENGIHPRAAEAVYQSLSSVYDGQVLCATHSPLFVGLAQPSDLLCFALAPSGATDVIPGSEHPILREWQRQVSLDTLFASGVLG